MSLQKLAADFRFLQFYTHMAHNTIKGETFFVDHPELGSLYATYEGIYDGLIERAIGLDEKIDILKAHKIASNTFEQSKKPQTFKECFGDLLKYEQYVVKQIEEMLPEYSEGSKQMLGNLCDQSEMRQYKFKQRIG